MADNFYFKSRFLFDKDRKKVWKIIANYLQKEISFDAQILEIGAGYCDFINNIQGAEKHALDIFEGIKEYAQSDVQTHIQSAVNMSKFSDEYFDVIFTSNFFEHLSRQEIEKTLIEIVRILKKSGKLIIIQPNFKYAYKEYFDDYTHQFIFTDVGLSDLLKTYHFEIEKVMPKFIPFSMKSKFPKLSFLIKLYLYLPIKPFAKQMLVVAKKEG